MRDMAAADPRLARFLAPSEARGDRLLAARIENGVKIFDMDASVIRWNILPAVRVTAYAINKQVPGPRLELTEGDHVRINFTNHLPEPATMHWHGLVVPNAMDGPAFITQFARNSKSQVVCMFVTPRGLSGRVNRWAEMRSPKRAIANRTVAAAHSRQP